MDLFTTLKKETEQDVSELKVVKFVTTYHDVEFERLPFHDWYKPYTESLAALRRRGYDRHPRSSEIFTLLADSLEKKLSPNLEPVAKIIGSWWVEWLGLAWERKGNLLIAYLDPEGLIYDKKKYIYTKQNFHYTSEHHFDITDKNSREWIALREFSDDFIEFHYGRKFVELPLEIQQETHIHLPPDGVLWPAGRSSDRYSIACYDYDIRTSRGIKVKPAQKCPDKIGARR